MPNPYTFQDVINRLTTTVQRDDLVPQYLDFVNRAIRDMALHHSFNQMKETGSGTVAMGSTRVQLPTDFKELQDGRMPIFDSVASGYVPVFVRSEIEKLLGSANALGLLPPISYIYTQDFSGGVASFNLDLPQNATAAHNVTMQYFGYPAYQTDPTQTTPLLTYYFEVVVLKAFSIAFESISDPIYKVHEAQYITALTEAIQGDKLNEQPDVTGQDQT